MAPKSSHSSNASLVSIDPAVASQITNAKSTPHVLHARTESTPVKSYNAPTHGYAKGHGRNNSAPSKNHKRSNSLRRAKNSTEVLRQRSAKKDRSGSSDQSNDPKRGRNFTVTNVGMGGALYLRPSAHQRPMSPAMSPPPQTPWTAPATTLVMPQDNEAVLIATEHIPLGRGPMSRTRSVSPKRLMERFNKAKEAQTRSVRPSHGRSQSFSTLDESRKSMSDAMPKTMRIVINRADQLRPKTSESGKPTLEIPIPHYRLGNPRFSTNGTPILRNSTFTRNSSTPSTRHVSTIKAEGPPSAPPPSSLRAFAKLQNFDINPDVPISSEVQGLMISNALPTRTSAVSSIGAAPSIYDELAQVYNDPSVVRFAHDIKEVTAATPARIIAQISSESFMDYELVSDFFLTFRSYMSTTDVLDLLLARLKWAIGRMTDDGRIIRIRTFAALRHWILNYFMDDFVPYRYLRERFCDEVNDMYEDVQNKFMGMQSDLKILRDLKRCWNGRCSLYWDGPEFSMDGDPDDEIYPGGVLGSRNPDYISPDEVRPAPGQEAFHVRQLSKPTSAFPTTVTIAPKPANRQPKQSIASSGPPASLQSEHSIQPKSCSIIVGSNNGPNANKSFPRAPIPRSVLARRHNAPAELKVATSVYGSQKGHHRRGGNSIDSTRERTPIEVPKSAVMLPEPHEGSVIRGFVYGPVEPFVQLPTNLPLSPSGKFDVTSSTSPTTRLRDEHNLGPNGPAVKNIFGSIRRALSGKPGSEGVALITVSSPISSSPTFDGKKSPMPLNVSRSQDELRKKAMRASSRGNIRIDLLCAAAVESYQAAQKQLQQTAEPDSVLNVSRSETLFPPPPMHRRFEDLTNKPSRIPSNGSGESGSILIVNDTDSEIPIMSGALHSTFPRASQQTGSSADHYMPNDHASFETQIAFQDDSRLEQARNNSSVESPAFVHDIVNPPAVSNHQAVTQSQSDRRPSSTASPNTMRHKHSLSSSGDPNRLLSSPGPTVSAATPPQDYQEEYGMSSPKGPAQMLRRRPGGDLRKNQNVHDFEPANVHHESVDSLAQTASMTDDSMVVMGNAHLAQQVTVQKAQRISMINTHSSQHLRPSFEAAVAGFSTIPDDDDGGLEATLAKLEGKYEKSPEIGSYSPVPADHDSLSEREMQLQPRDEIPSSSPIPDNRYMRQATPKSPQQQPPTDVHTHHRKFSQAPFPAKHPVMGLQIQSMARSESSTESVPILKRDIDDAQPADLRHKVGSISDRHMLPGHMKMDSNEENVLRGPSPGSFLTPDNSNTHSGQSLLIDDDDDRSDLSSEISVDIINYSEALGSSNSPLLVAPGTAVSGLEIPSHPLAHSSFVNLSLHPSLALDSKTSPPDNPKSSEPILMKVGNADSTVVRGNAASRHNVEVQRGGKISAGPAHVPFVLACDSQILAQQLTLIEQSALTEIEWSDLVDMRWSNNAANVLDWAEYISTRTMNGIDLVITRFNLMVKWALSEIVLTQNAEERVRVITKFIHVAAHARRLHNYATMLQLTIALTSSDCTRMTKTWDLVPGPDKSLLKNMESLIQPVRNFHDLRLEMESADLTDGCIPFIGLYIHDLTYNAQKPIEIEVGRGQEPLINFERFRTVALIVKGLLRLIDASSRYEFDPIHGVVERCLWIAALPDERIRSLSRSLQHPLIQHE